MLTLDIDKYRFYLTNKDEKYYIIFMTILASYCDFHKDNKTVNKMFMDIMGIIKAKNYII